MPRDASKTYSLPSGTSAVSGTAISSSDYNTFLSDLVADLNLPRPVAVGGTGVATLSSGKFLVGNGTGNVTTTKTAPTGDVVGTSDTQTLTNKTLTNPTLGGTVTLDAGAIGTADVADAAVTTAKVADDAITNAKLASGTAGNLITYDAFGNPAAVATGTAGHVLTSAGAGSPPAFAAPVVKAWVNFNGATGSIRGSFNVSSISKIGTGNFRVHFINDMPDGNYAVLVSSSTYALGGLDGRQSTCAVVQVASTYPTNYVDVAGYNSVSGAAADPIQVNVSVLR